MKKIILLMIVSFLMANNSKYCKNNINNRKTIIYIDESSVNNKNYVNNLINNLKHTFIPYEKVEIFFINPKTAEIKEMFNSCVPILSKKEIEKIHKKGGLYLFGGNPIEQANEDLMFFYSYMRKVLKKAIHKNNIEVDSKNLVELLYNESNKFENPLNRIIIVSDMIQNSEDISKNNILKLSKNKLIPKIKEYQTNFNYSNVFVLITKKEFRSSNFKKLKTFWQLYFDINKANMKSFNVGLDSILPKTRQLVTKRYEGKILYPDNSSMKVQLLFNYLQNGKINNGWLIINELDNVPFKGKIKFFDNKPKEGIFKIVSKEPEIHSFTNGEILNLKFIGKNIKGKLEMDNTNLTIITPKGNKLKNPNIKITLKEIE